LDSGPGVRIWIAPESGFGCGRAVSDGVEADRVGRSMAVSVKVAVGSEVGKVAVGIAEATGWDIEAVGSGLAVGLGRNVHVADGRASVAVGGRLRVKPQLVLTRTSKTEQQGRVHLKADSPRPVCCFGEIIN